MVTNPRLPNGDPIKIELISEMGLVAASRVARGELKAEGWLSQSSSFVNYTNLTRINLGPEQQECVPLFRTPFVLAARAEHAPLIGAQRGQFSWSRVLGESPEKSKSKTKPQPVPDEGLTSIALSHTQPRNSTTGLGALITLAYAASAAPDLTVPLLERIDVRTALQRVQRVVASYPASENFLLAKTSSSSGARPRFALTTQQQVFQFNQLHASEGKRLVSLAPIEGSYYDDYQLCTSNADWVTPGHRASLALFGEFLRSRNLQSDAEKLGFEPIPSGEAPSDSESQGSLPRPAAYPPVSGEVVSHLIESWPVLRRPAAFILVLDISGSMDGDPLMVGKEQFRRLVAASSPNDLKGLITFNTNHSVVAPLAKDTRELFPKLDVLQSLGGSAVYDGIGSALTLAQDPSLAEFRKVIVVYTDGNDKNSELSLTSAVAMAKRVAETQDLNLFIIGVDREGADYSDLERIAEAADGTFRRSALIAMDSVFQEIGQGV
jgi:Mg-chelatase subunit ChlD